MFAKKRAVTRFVLLLAVPLVTICSVSGQNLHNSSGTAGLSRDPVAISIMEKAIAAAGGKALIKSILDFKAQGTITYHWADQDVPGRVEIESRGLDQFRMDVLLENQQRTVVLSKGGGKVLDHS